MLLGSHRWQLVLFFSVLQTSARDTGILKLWLNWSAHNEPPDRRYYTDCILILTVNGLTPMDGGLQLYSELASILFELSKWVYCLIRNGDLLPSCLEIHDPACNPNILFLSET